MEEKQKYKISYIKASGLKTCSNDIKDERTIPDILKRHCEERPDKEAVVFAHTNGTREAVTYKALYENSRTVAKSFLTLGVKPEEGIAINMRSCPQWLYAVFGAMIAGARPIGLSFTYTDGSDVIAMMKKLRTCSAIILDPGRDDEKWNVFHSLIKSYDDKGHVESDKLPYLRYLIYHDCRKRQTPNILTMEQMMNWHNADIILPTLKPDDIAIMFQTSGSTGVPKAVAHTHRAIVSVQGCFSGPDFQQFVFTNPKGPLFNDRPFTWIGGFPSTVLSGTTRVTRSGYCEPPEDHIAFLIDVIKREKCTDMIALPPLVHEFLERQDDLGDDWPIETLGSGGQPMTKQFTDGIGKLCKQILIGYGATEFMICSSMVIHHPDEFQDFCCGNVAPGIDTKIVDEAGEIVPINTRGEILIKSKYLFEGYFNDPEKTNATFTSDGWFKTDDIGFMNEDGVIYCGGRKSEMILSGGMNVAPSILEATLERYPGVSQAICVPVPHDFLYQVICACVMLEEGSDVREEQLRVYCEEIHNDKSRMFTVLPTYYMFTESFPETFTGKTARKLLTAQATQLFSGK